MQLPVGEVAAILGSSCGVSERVALSWSIDSRTIQPGAVFFAIHGPHFDGHRFVAQALERGAVAAVVDNRFREQSDPSVARTLIATDNTTRALQRVAQAVRWKWGRTVVAVTGSTGKTTTKELIAATLAARHTVHKSPGNLNNQYGVPLTLLALEPIQDVAVLELAMSAPGDIAHLAQIAEPQVGVVTNVAPVHLEFFGSLESIAQSKRELMQNLKPPATAVLNYDDPLVRRFRDGFEGRVVTFGFGSGADFQALDFRTHNYVMGPEIATLFRVRGPAYSGEYYIPLPGRHSVENALAAIATASLFDLSADELWQALYYFKPLHQRTETLSLPNNVTVIDDSYNSNPRAMEKILETLAAWPDAGRRIVVAGEMLELGSSSPEWHREIGRRCADSRVDWLLAVQGDARFFLEGARERGFPAERARFFADAEKAGEFCRGLVQPEDVVLVKGSRGVQLERVVELLR